MSEIKYETAVVGVGPLVQEMLRELEVVEIIDEAMNYQPEIEATYGDLSQAVIINRMSLTPQPLYGMTKWAEEHGIDKLLGIKAEWLDDDRLGAMLEGLADKQVDIWSKIVVKGVEKFGMEPEYLHGDTTSVYFEGSYEDEEGKAKDEPNSPLLIEGYNKDGKRKKAQYVLSLVNSGRVPLWYKAWDGNQSDDGVYVSDMNDMGEMGLNLADVVLVGDRKLCNQENLLSFSRTKQQFLAPHPWRENAKKVWLAVWEQLQSGELAWLPVDYVSRNQARKPEAERTKYRVCEVPYPLVDNAKETTYELRWVFSWCGDKAKKDKLNREKAVQTAQQEFERIQGLLGKYDYKSRKIIERRIDSRLRKCAATRYFDYTLKGTDANQKWRLTWQILEPALDHDQKFDGMALFCTNIPQVRLSAPNVLCKYKEQIHVEQSIDFIKSPIHIRPMWLHSPRRIAGLTLLIMIAVFMASLLEFHIRRHLDQTGDLIHGLMPENRDNPFPSANKILQAFQHYALVVVQHPDGLQDVHFPAFRPVQQQIWDILLLAFFPP